MKIDYMAVWRKLVDEQATITELNWWRDRILHGPNPLGFEQREELDQRIAQRIWDMTPDDRKGGA